MHGGEALAILQRWLPDVIVLDVRRPVMDGAAFLDAQNASRRLRDIPVIVMSASLKLQNIGDRPHASVMLRKPFEIDDLLAQVEALALRSQLAPA